MDAKARKRIEELKKQQQKIAAEIAKLKNKRATVLREIAKKMEDAGIGIDELKSFLGNRQKYRNPETGESWSGRGRKPLWIDKALKAGKKLEDFLA